MRGALAAAAALLMWGAGAAAADTIDNLIGNTLVVSYSNGAEERFYLDADGGFRMTTGDGIVVDAGWTREGDQFCIIMEDMEPQCSSVPAEKNVGDAWEKDGEDGPVRYEIVAGR